jgi:toxin ParE1/3/4
MHVTLSPSGAGIRSCAHGKYVLFFTVTRCRLTIVRILHGAMDIPAHFPAEPD